jgi:hypothetical protein
MEGLSDSSEDNSDSQDGAGPSTSAAATAACEGVCAAASTSSSLSSSPSHSSDGNHSKGSATVTSADNDDSTGFEPQVLAACADPDAIHLSTSNSNKLGHPSSDLTNGGQESGENTDSDKVGAADAVTGGSPAKIQKSDNSAAVSSISENGSGREVDAVNSSTTASIEKSSVEVCNFFCSCFLFYLFF